LPPSPFPRSVRSIEGALPRHPCRAAGFCGHGRRWSPREARVHRPDQPVTDRRGSERACTPRRGDRAIGSRRSSGPEPGSASGRRPRPLPVSAHR